MRGWLSMHPGELPLRAFLGPVADDLDDPTVREVVVNRPGEVGVERGSGWTWRNVPEFTYERLDQIGILAGYLTGRDLDSEHPFAGSTLPDGHRIQICRPPATFPGVIAIAIRKPPVTARRLDDDDFPDLFSETNAPVSRTRAAGKTIDVCGRTGSGKTDFSRRLMQETDAGARVLTIESDAEYGRVGPRNSVALFYNEQHPQMQPEAVVAAALRMRPDEIWFQETRGREAWAVMRARAAGHRGGGTTWHADEGKEIEALMLMMRQHPATVGLTDEKLRAICLQYVDIIVWCDRVPDAGFKVPRVWMRGAEAAA